MSDLPPGWEWATVGAIAETSLGKMLDKKKATGKHPTPYLRNINVRWGSFDLSDLAIMDIHPDQIDRVLAQPGDVIACEGGEPGRAAVWQGPHPIALQKALHRVRPTNVVKPEYLALLLEHLAKSHSLNGLFTGSTIKHLPQEKLRLIRVPLPPRPEQERIVATIEGYLSRLDAAERSLRSAEVRAAVLTQRIIDAALEGERMALGRLLREPLRNGLSAPASSTGSVRVVTLTAVTRSEFVDAHTKLIEPGSRSTEDLWMAPGDLFIQRSNTPELVGTASLYRGDSRWAIFPDLLIRIRIDDKRVDPEYLELALRSTSVRQYFQRAAQGIAGSMPKISQPTVEAAEIPLPGLHRQSKIVDQVTKQLTNIRRLDASLDLAVVRQQSLRRAILAAAFSGMLVPQDPDDEPASVLLEQIRAERAASTPAKKKQKATVS